MDLACPVLPFSFGYTLFLALAFAVNSPFPLFSSLLSTLLKLWWFFLLKTLIALLAPSFAFNHLLLSPNVAVSVLLGVLPFREIFFLYAILRVKEKKLKKILSLTIS